MSVGFAVYVRGEQVEFRILGETWDEPSPLVSWARRGCSQAVLMGRLYYRSELLARLPESAAADEELSDAELALAAYAHGGADGVARLEGDFSLVIWDARKRVLLGSRDPLGGYPLYWTSSQGVLAMSTSQRPLLALLPERTLNLDYLGEFLMLPALSFHEVPSEQCVWRDIHRVVAGTMAQADLRAARIERRVFWDWQEQIVDPGTDLVDELGQQVAELLREAVRQRARGRTASHFSGGMDSTAVALLARDCLRADGGELPLHALSLVYRRMSSLLRETFFLESGLADSSGIEAHLVEGDDLLAYDTFFDPPALEEPYGGLLDLAKDRAMVRSAAAAGCQTILTGLGADDMLDVLPHHVAELLRRGRIGAAWKESCRWAAATNGSPWRFLRQFGLCNLLPAALRGGVGSWLRGGYADRENRGQGVIAPWILPEFARAAGLRRHGLRGVRSLWGNCQPVGLSLALGAIRAFCGDRPRWSLAAPEGILVAHPFRDSRLLRLGLGIQARFVQEPGRPKPVLVEAMKNVLPECIRARRRKGHYNEVYYTGLARHLPALEAMVRRCPLEELGLLDKDVFLHHLRRAALGIEPSTAGSIRLDLTLALVHWLSTRDAIQDDDLPSPARGRGAGGEGIVAEDTRIASARVQPALTLTLSQRERGPDSLPSPARGRGAGGEGSFDGTNVAPSRRLLQTSKG